MHKITNWGRESSIYMYLIILEHYTQMITSVLDASENTLVSPFLLWSLKLLEKCELVLSFEVVYCLNQSFIRITVRKNKSCSDLTNTYHEWKLDLVLVWSSILFELKFYQKYCTKNRSYSDLTDTCYHELFLVIQKRICMCVLGMCVCICIYVDGMLVKVWRLLIP